MKTAEIYIPRTGDLITFIDFNDVLGMIVDSGYFIGHNSEGMIKYKFVFPDTKPFQFAREIGGARHVFDSNHLMSIYNKPFASPVTVVVSLQELKTTLGKGKWVVKHRKKM